MEIHELLIIRTASGSLPSLCGECPAGDSILLGPEQASAVTEIPARTIYRLVEASVVHYREEANGKLTVCVKTLLARANQVSKLNDEYIYQAEHHSSLTEGDEKENERHE